MRTNLLSFFLLFVGWSCQMTDEQTIDDDPITEDDLSKSYELIASNLSKKGSHNLELLEGDWRFVSLAYTEDGNVCMDVVYLSPEKLLSKGVMKITKYDYLSVPWFFWPYFLYYSFSDNLMLAKEDNLSAYSYILRVFDDHKAELEILDALMNAYSFVIRDDELIIQFTGLKKTNLLIYKKETPPQIPLNGTKWKPVGLVDTDTGKITEIPVKDCENCVTLSFYSDYHAILQYNSSSDFWDLSPGSQYRSPTVMYWGLHYDDISQNYYILKFHIKSYTVENDELKIFYYDFIGYPPRKRGDFINYPPNERFSKNYLLFKKMSPL